MHAPVARLSSAEVDANCDGACEVGNPEFACRCESHRLLLAREAIALGRWVGALEQLENPPAAVAGRPTQFVDWHAGVVLRAQPAGVGARERKGRHDQHTRRPRILDGVLEITPH